MHERSIMGSAGKQTAILPSMLDNWTLIQSSYKTVPQNYSTQTSCLFFIAGNSIKIKHPEFVEEALRRLASPVFHRFLPTRLKQFFFTHDDPFVSYCLDDQVNPFALKKDLTNEQREAYLSLALAFGRVEVATYLLPLVNHPSESGLNAEYEHWRKWEEFLELASFSGNVDLFNQVFALARDKDEQIFCSHQKSLFSGNPLMLDRVLETLGDQPLLNSDCMAALMSGSVAMFSKVSLLLTPELQRRSPPLHGSFLLMQAAATGNLVMFNLVREKHPNLDIDQYVLIHAASSGNTEMFNTILKLNPSLEISLYMLSQAAESGNLNMFNMVLTLKPELRTCYGKSSYSTDTLYFAARSGNLEMLEAALSIYPKKLLRKLVDQFILEGGIASDNREMVDKILMLNPDIQLTQKMIDKADDNPAMTKHLSHIYIQNKLIPQP